ncbi:hypothetical protein [Streptomyces sp. SM10]|uniref:hypothetical protein n=1 Tax=Streptomyces sp. SM10 TaxID=565556 RepID=UPI0035BBA6F3
MTSGSTPLPSLIRLSGGSVVSTDIGRGERWAPAHPGHPLHDGVTEAVDARRTGYHGGHRGTLGLAHLVLGA